MLALLTDPSAWLALVTLTVLEVVLGVDNLVVLAVLVARLPKAQQGIARTVGLALAMGTRVMLLFCITWLASLTTPFIVILGQEISGRDLALIGGGLFLLAKSVLEIHAAVEGGPNVPEGNAISRSHALGVMGVVFQIALIDVVFSLDSVFTAIGFVQRIEVMVAAIVLAMVFMMLVAARIGQFIEDHPTIKVLALAFLLLVGVALIADGFDLHIPKGYLYFAMAFAIVVEMVNMRVRSRGAAPKA
jgi:predicted tellurium resistance membrane protein TerC